MRPTTISTEIIEISSGSEDEKSTKESLATVRSQLRNSKEDAKDHKKRLETVIKEISVLRAEQEATLEGAQREVARIRAEHDSKMAEIAGVFNALTSGHEQELESAAQEIERLKSLLVRFAEKNEQVLELLTCDVCTNAIRRPFTLKNCGHTFCYGCLREWFSVTQDRFQLMHPMYDPMHRFEKLSLATASQIALGLANQYQQMADQVTLEDVLPAALQQHPHYNCPLCREHVYAKPLEVYTLKAIIPLVQELGDTGGGETETEGQWTQFFA